MFVDYKHILVGHYLNDISIVFAEQQSHILLNVSLTIYSAFSCTNKC